MSTSTSAHNNKWSPVILNFALIFMDVGLLFVQVFKHQAFQNANAPSISELNDARNEILSSLLHLFPKEIKDATVLLKSTKCSIIRHANAAFEENRYPCYVFQFYQDSNPDECLAKCVLPVPFCSCNSFMTNLSGRHHQYACVHVFAAILHFLFSESNSA